MTALSPFPIDPEVMAAIRPMAPADVPRVAALHRADMGRSLWARLGTPFLERLYAGLLRNRHFLGYVYETEGAIGGFIAGSTDTGRMFREVLWRETPHLLLPALLGILRDPTLLVPLLATPAYFRRAKIGTEPNFSKIGLCPYFCAESLFCSFVPELRGRRVSGHVNKVLFDELRARGHRFVKISTEVDNAGAVRQLTSWGFERRGEFRFYGKAMVLFVLDLEACERVRQDPKGS